MATRASVVTFRRATLLVTVVSSIVISIFMSPLQAQTTDLVTAAVDPANRVVLLGQRAPWALPQNNQAMVPGDALLNHLTLVLRRSPQEQKAFEQFLEQLQDPTSPNYHRWLTPIQIGKRFGATQHDIRAISEWLRSQGFQVNSVANSRIMIDFSGNASQVAETFAAEMNYYVVNGEQRMAAAGDPQIPAALTGVIQSIGGLYTVDDHPYHGSEQAQVPAPGAGSELPALSICNGGSCEHFVTPADFDVIYDVFSSYAGAGQTIAIIGRAKVYNPDIENFQTLTGLQQHDPTVIVPPDGVDPGPPAGTGGTASGDQVEATLDVLRAGGVASEATIDLVVSADSEGVSGLRIAAAYVVDTNPVSAQIMNISFGACEADRTEADVLFWDTLFGQAAAEGISVFVASGDSGAAGCDEYFHNPPQNQIASPNYICSSSYSTCVGGTEFADTANPGLYWSQTNYGGLQSAMGYIPEGAWNEPLNSQGATWAASSGGGYSSYIATPSWQTGTGVPGTQGRYTPDIAFTSAGHDGYFGCLAASGGAHPGDCVIRNGEFYFEYFFGTSAAAPDMAGITALLNEKMFTPQGQLNPRLYQLATDPTNAVFHDVTVATSGVSGCVVTTPSMCNNSTPSPTGLTGGLAGYLITAGYDEVTGLGSIDVTNLLTDWAVGYATETSLQTSQDYVNLGVAVTFSAYVNPYSGGDPPPTGTVTFYDGTTTLGSSNLSTVTGQQVATLTTSTLSVGTHPITAIYRGDENNSPSTSELMDEFVSGPTFNWAANGSTTGTVFSGQSATYNFTATPTAAGTFPANVTFACSGLPDRTVSCSFNPSQISAGLGSTPVQVTIATSGPNTPAGSIRRRGSERRSPLLPLILPLAGVVMVGFARGKMSRSSVIASFSIMPALLGLLVACGGGSGNSTPPVVVAVSPGTPATVFPNDAADKWPAQTAQFTATVSNTANTAVIWAVTTANGGTIDKDSGVYTAPTVAAGLPTSVVVTATSLADPTKSGQAMETLTAATIPGTYPNIMVTATESTTANPVPVTLTVQ